MTGDRQAAPGGREALRTATFTVVGLVAVAVLWALRDVLILVGFAALLAFALEPAVAWLTSLRLPRGGLSRPFAAALVMITLVGLGAWALVRVVPQVVAELSGFVDRAPGNLDRLIAWAREQAAARGWDALRDVRAPDAAALLRGSGGALLGAVGRALGNLGGLVGLALLPVLAFYLLSEREAVEGSALRFVPEAVRPSLRQALRAVDRALRGYVRGQVVVCTTIGLAGWLAFWALGLPASLLLGVVVGLAEAIPILGFWIASGAIVLAGWSVAPATAGWAFVAYLTLNQLVGLLVTPRVMGRHMRMHPFVVMVSILSGGVLLGAAGAVLALPLAAALQSVIVEFAPVRAAPKTTGAPS
jgi:predicted PurR-regulated permease PerM